MAALQIAERQVGDVTVLDLWGQITIGEASETLRATIKQLIENGRTCVLLHLGGVRQVDSSGLGSLVAVYTALQKVGGDLKLVQLSERLEDLMVMTKLVTVFDTYNDEAVALESFRPKAERIEATGTSSA
jgi:anti-sigma B factor antagonist